jgi:hypothetical protein
MMRSTSAVAHRLRLEHVQGPAERVADDRLLAGRARKLLVELELDAGQSSVVEAGIAEHLRGDGLLRIDAALLGVEAQPDDLLRLEGLGLLPIGLPSHVDEAARTIAEQGQKFIRIESERPPHCECDRGGVLDLLRVRVDRRRPLADGELDARAVVDRPPARRERQGLSVLVRGDAIERRGTHGLEPARARQRDGEDEREEHDEQPDAPVGEPPAHGLSFDPSLT